MAVESHPSDKSRNVRWMGTVLVTERGGEEEVPGGVEIEPSLRAEPTGGDSGDVEEGVAVHAHQLGAVPGEESSGGLADLRRMFNHSETYGATLPLIAQGPAQAEEA